MHVNIEGIVLFSSNNGVTVTKKALECDPVVLMSYLRIAFAHLDEECLKDACCAGEGPLAGRDEVSLVEYLEIVNRHGVRRNFSQSGG